MGKLKTEEVQSLAQGFCGGIIEYGFVGGRGDPGGRAGEGEKEVCGRGGRVGTVVKQVVR